MYSIVYTTAPARTLPGLKSFHRLCGTNGGRGAAQPPPKLPLLACLLRQLRTLCRQAFELQECVNPQGPEWLAVRLVPLCQLPEMFRKPRGRAASARDPQLSEACPVAGIATAPATYDNIAVQLQVVRGVSQRADRYRPPPPAGGSPVHGCARNQGKSPCPCRRTAKQRRQTTLDCPLALSLLPRRWPDSRMA